MTGIVLGWGLALIPLGLASGLATVLLALVTAAALATHRARLAARR